MADQGKLSEFFVHIDGNQCGESIDITTEFYCNGDVDGVFLSQKITLQGYTNSAQINLCGITLTPEILRNLANQIELETIKAKEMTRKQR